MHTYKKEYIHAMLMLYVTLNKLSFRESNCSWEGRWYHLYVIDTQMMVFI